NVPQAVVPAVRATGSKPQLAERQAHVVANHQQVVVFKLVEIDGLPNRPPTEVHERLRLQEQDFLAVFVPFSDISVETALGATDTWSGCQSIHHREADIVAGAVVTFARIAEADDQFHVFLPSPPGRGA